MSYRHAWRRNLSSGLGLFFPRMMACRQCHLERDFYCFRDDSCKLRRTSISSDVCVLPPFPWYQHMLISGQNRRGKRFIHLPSPPDIMSLAGNCISYAGPFSNIPPLFAAAITRSSREDERLTADVGAEASASSPIPPTNKTQTGTVTKTALSFEVNSLDAMTVSPPWVNSHDSTSLGTPSSALPGSSYSKSVEAKAAALSLSGGNFRRSVYVHVVDR